MGIDERLAAGRPIAPWWHTALLAGVFVAMALAGALGQRSLRASATSGHPPVAPLYASLVIVEWALVLYVWRGGRTRSATPLGDWIGGRWRGLRDVVLDVGRAVALWLAWAGIATAWSRWSGPGPGSPVQQLLPRGPLEVALWIALAASAGFAEELVFRGYFQRQLAALTGRTGFGVLLQAALFGIAHGYQGAEACAKIALYGLLFGGVAVWWRSLRPGMIAHALTDLFAGLG